MRKHYSVMAAIVIAWAVSSTVFAQDAEVNLSEIRRQLSDNIKEPNYQNEPRYALLVTGLNAEKRNWLVLDGFETVYVDLNGNGDLTDEGEKFGVMRKNELAVRARKLAFSANFFVLGRIHDMEITLDVFVPNPEYEPQTEAETARLVRYRENGWVQGGICCQPGIEGRQSISGVLFSRSPEDAQVTWLKGPLVIIPAPELYGEQFVLKTLTNIRDGKQIRSASFDVYVGTFGLPTKNSVEVCHTPISLSEIPVGVSPIATFGFDTKAISVPLKDGRGGRYFGHITIPDGDLAESVSVSLAFPDWKERNVGSSTRTAPIQSADK